MMRPGGPRRDAFALGRDSHGVAVANCGSATRRDAGYRVVIVGLALGIVKGRTSTSATTRRSGRVNAQASRSHRLRVGAVKRGLSASPTMVPSTRSVRGTPDRCSRRPAVTRRVLATGGLHPGVRDRAVPSTLALYRDYAFLPCFSSIDAYLNTPRRGSMVGRPSARWSAHRRCVASQILGSPGASHEARSASARLRNFLTGIASILQPELFLQLLRVGLVLQAERITLHRVQGLGRRHENLHVTVGFDGAAQIVEAERTSQPRQDVDLRSVGGDVLNDRIVARQILRSDLLDGRVSPDRGEGPAQPLHVLRRGSHEEIDVLRESTDAQHVEGDRTHEEIFDALVAQRPEERMYRFG